MNSRAISENINVRKWIARCHNTLIVVKSNGHDDMKGIKIKLTSNTKYKTDKYNANLKQYKSNKATAPYIEI